MVVLIYMTCFLAVVVSVKWLSYLEQNLLWLPLCTNGRPSIIFFRCGFFFFLFFLACSQWLQIGCLPYFHTWCGLSANLECKSQMCCAQLAANTGCKNSPSAHHRTTLSKLSGYIFANSMYQQSEKVVKQQYHLHMSCVLRIWRTLGH